MKIIQYKNYIFIIVLLCIFLSPSITFSGDWRVTPIRLDMGREAKSGVINVINEGGEKIQVQMKAFEWIQDAEGKDQYTETSDIVFFPKIMVVEKNEQRILRAGIKMPAVAKEKTYRLFIEEIPEPKKPEGTTIAITIRFGVPIFVKPVKEDAKGLIEKVELSKGGLNVVVKNTGNVYFTINSILIKGKNITGKEIFSKELSGWYLLNGTSRIYSTQIPQEICSGIAKLDVEVKTNRFNLDGKLDVDKAMCLP